MSDEYEALCLSVYSSLQKIFRKQVRQWEPEIDRCIEDKLDFMLELIPDLDFISQMAAVQKKLIATGIPMCVPEYRAESEKVFTAEGMCDPNLALNR